MSQSIAFFEVMGQDAKKLQSFYGGLFGWSFSKVEGMDYSFINTPEGQVMGGIGQAPQGPGWGTTFYVPVDDIAAAVAHAVEAGGTVLMPPTEVPETTIAVVADPEGHPIGIAQAR
jgi:uncharacterized protein